jgi:hypothetical protein
MAPSLANGPNFLIFLFSPPIHTFFSIFFLQNRSLRVYNPDFAYILKPKTLQTLNPILNPIP